MVAKLIEYRLLQSFIDCDPFEWVELKHAECKMGDLGISVFKILLG